MQNLNKEHKISAMYDFNLTYTVEVAAMKILRANPAPQQLLTGLTKWAESEEKSKFISEVDIKLHDMILMSVEMRSFQILKA